MATKAEFSPQALQELIEKIHKDPGSLEKDWRELVRSHFKLSPDQEKGLAALSPEKVRHIQEHLANAAKHIREGGTVTGELVKRAPHEQTKDLVYDVVIELAAKGPDHQQR